MRRCESLNTAVVPRLDRGTQYSRGFSIELRRLWNTGSPGRAGRRHRVWMTGRLKIESGRRDYLRRWRGGWRGGLLHAVEAQHLLCGGGAQALVGFTAGVEVGRLSAGEIVAHVDDRLHRRP